MSPSSGRPLLPAPLGSISHHSGCGGLVRLWISCEYRVSSQHLKSPGSKGIRIPPSTQAVPLRVLRVPGNLADGPEHHLSDIACIWEVWGDSQVSFFMRLETEFDGLQVTLGFREWDYRGLKRCKGSLEGYVGVLGPLQGFLVDLGRVNFGCFEELGRIWGRPRLRLTSSPVKFQGCPGSERCHCTSSCSREPGEALKGGGGHIWVHEASVVHSTSAGWLEGGERERKRSKTESSGSVGSVG